MNKDGEGLPGIWLDRNEACEIERLSLRRSEWKWENSEGLITSKYICPENEVLNKNNTNLN
jgi:hypothetical protein